LPNSIELPDVNVLVAASYPGHQNYEVADNWLKQTAAFATTPLTEYGLVRCLMIPAIIPQIVLFPAALKTLESIMADSEHHVGMRPPISATCPYCLFPEWAIAKLLIINW